MEDAATRSQVQPSPEVAALRHLGQGLCVWSADGCLIYCNPAFAECLGFGDFCAAGFDRTRPCLIAPSVTAP